MASRFFCGKRFKAPITQLCPFLPSAHPPLHPFVLPTSIESTHHHISDRGCLITFVTFPHLLPFLPVFVRPSKSAKHPMLKLLRGTKSSLAISSNVPSSEPPKDTPPRNDQIAATLNGHGGRNSTQPPPDPSEDSSHESEPQPASSEVFPSTDPTGEATPTAVPPVGVVQRVRRLSFRSFGFFYGRSTINVGTTTEGDDDGLEDAEPEIDAQVGPASEQDTSAPSDPAPTAGKTDKAKKGRRLTKAEKHASAYALLLRSIIIGSPAPVESPKSKLPLGKSKPPAMKKLKSELLKPKEANKLIAQVRKLPTPGISPASLLVLIDC